jgi:methylmalonyl-CoA mutase C-terminal domain/subunit
MSSTDVGTLNTARNKIRVLIAKPGLDGHDRGAKVIARALRDAGFEVIYTGLHQTPEMIIEAAVDEDVHVVGMSILSGAHNALVPEVINGVKGAGLVDALFLVGGIIPDEDIEPLNKAGAQMIFTPGTSLESIINYIDKHAPQR